MLLLLPYRNVAKILLLPLYGNPAILVSTLFIHKYYLLFKVNTFWHHYVVCWLPKSILLKSCDMFIVEGLTRWLESKLYLSFLKFVCSTLCFIHALFIVIIDKEWSSKSTSYLIIANCLFQHFYFQIGKESH